MLEIQTLPCFFSSEDKKKLFCQEISEEVQMGDCSADR